MRRIPVTSLLFVWAVAAFAAAPKKAPVKPAAKAVAPPAETDEQKIAKRAARLWSLQPVGHPEVPTNQTASTNPIDAFIAEKWKGKSLRPVGKAD